MKRVLALAKPYWPQLLAAVLLMTGVGLMQGLMARLIQPVIDRVRFVQADLYDARTALPEPASFDQVYVTWGAIIWLPDIVRWAEIVAYFLKPGGSLYLAGHVLQENEGGR